MNKISISAVENTMKERFVPTTEIDWYGNNLVVKESLSLAEMFSFVDGVVNGCFNQETYDYMPEAKDFVLQASVVEYYSNVKLPENLDRKYAILYRTDLVQTILENVNRGQFDEMVHAINCKVKSIADTNTAKLAKMLTEIGENISTILGKYSETYSDVTKEDVNNIISALSNGGFNEEKIVQLVLDKNSSEQKTIE